jgi:hypothetical protein
MEALANGWSRPTPELVSSDKALTTIVQPIYLSLVNLPPANLATEC